MFAPRMLFDRHGRYGRNARAVDMLGCDPHIQQQGAAPGCHQQRVTVEQVEVGARRTLSGTHHVAQ